LDIKKSNTFNQQEISNANKDEQNRFHSKWRSTRNSFWKVKVGNYKPASDNTIRYTKKMGISKRLRVVASELKRSTKNNSE
jgi:hypothetical protein